MLGLFLGLCFGLWQAFVADHSLPYAFWSLIVVIRAGFAPLLCAMTLTFALIARICERVTSNMNRPNQRTTRLLILWNDIKLGMLTNAIGYALLFGATFLVDTKYTLVTPLLFWFAWRYFRAADSFLAPYRKKIFGI